MLFIDLDRYGAKDFLYRYLNADSHSTKLKHVVANLWQNPDYYGI